jgi:hypothetical protein
MYDLARLRGSSIANEEILEGRLIDALAWFCPSKHAYELLRASAPLHQSQASIQQFGYLYKDCAPVLQDTHDNVKEKEKSLARTVLRDIRYDINRYRDGRWDGLVHARNRLMKTVVAFGLTMLLLLGFAIVAGTDPKTVGEVAVLYGVGAITGLFNRLYLDAQTNLAVEDYGLTSGRLIYTPLISGLASIGGLVVTAAAIKVTVPPTFDLTVQNYIVAALFGLTPGLLISRLQRQVEQHKQDLVSSDATREMA